MGNWAETRGTYPKITGIPLEKVNLGLIQGPTGFPDITGLMIVLGTVLFVYQFTLLKRVESPWTSTYFHILFLP